MESHLTDPFDDPVRSYLVWRASPSQESGYTKCYSAISDEGDEIQVDYNIARDMVRIYVSLERERGKEYVSVIKSGAILQERDVSGRRMVELTGRIAPFHDLFRYMPDERVLEAIGGAYNLPVESDRAPGRSFYEQVPIDWGLRQLRLGERLRNHLERKRQEELRPRPWYRRLLRRAPAEMLDLALFVGVAWAWVEGIFTVGEFAFASGFLGLMLGALDWHWRQRDPFLPKVILLLAVSAATVYYQVQMRLWGILI